MSLFWLAQILGGTALLIQIVTYQRNTRNQILLGVMLAQILFVGNFILLGGYTGAAVNVIGASRNFIFTKYKKLTKNYSLLLIFLTIQLLVSIFTWSGFLSILPLLGAWLSTLAFWQDEPRTIRRIIFFMPLLWLGYNFAIHSYAGMISNIFVFISTSIAIYRFDINK